MKIRIASPLQCDSIVDGEGIRIVLWTQGCSHNCEGCHNPQTHSFNEGTLVEVEDIINQIKEFEFQDRQWQDLRIARPERSRKIHLAEYNQQPYFCRRRRGPLRRKYITGK